MLKQILVREFILLCQTLVSQLWAADTDVSEKSSQQQKCASFSSCITCLTTIYDPSDEMPMRKDNLKVTFWAKLPRNKTLNDFFRNPTHSQINHRKQEHSHWRTIAKRHLHLCRGQVLSSRHVVLLTSLVPSLRDGFFRLDLSSDLKHSKQRLQQLLRKSYQFGWRSCLWPDEGVTRALCGSEPSNLPPFHTNITLECCTWL